ncbi:SHOCT domain-containing protein [Clostridium sp. PL3]|uniref:SHOCT domain-containing protein n=1 Tax=Clostridium thailandense TaxID=2794346 RepID=A0A949WT71_9CLOT|nr:SHOCT domain-containing protein [Clostridium thailandense]MBV7275856.1 SHOCT domain-containing protein [Clostridium thailandense]
MMGYGGMMGYAFGNGFGNSFGNGIGSTVNLWWALGLGLLRVLLVVGIIILVVRMFKRNNNSYSSNKAIEILKQRYAVGEINEEEYKKKLEVLR